MGDCGSDGLNTSLPATCIDSAFVFTPQASSFPALSALLQVPGLEEDFGSDAAAFLAQLVGNGKRFSATVVKRERGGGAREKHPRKAADKLHVVLKADGDEKLDVAREMLLEGLARLPRLHKVGLCCHWIPAAVAARTAQLG